MQSMVTAIWNERVERRWVSLCGTWFRRIAAVCVVFGALSPTDTTYGAFDKGEPDDRDIAVAVMRALAVDEATPDHRIDVGVEDGVVMLEGSVHSLRAADRATRVARTVRGVRSVVNRLGVNAVERDDRSLRKDVLGSLEEHSILDSGALNVTVEDGAVTIAGQVRNAFVKQLCRKAVRGVRGVRSLKNEVEVQESMTLGSEKIEADVERALAINVWTTHADVEVSVSEGAATVRGVVGSAQQKTMVENTALLAGAREVDARGVKIDPKEHLEHRRKVPPVRRADEEVHAAVIDTLRFDPRIRSEDIEIRVEDGLVTLTGRVGFLGARQAAENDTSHTVGVIGVRNYLRTRPDRDVPDERLHDRVQQALLRDADVDRVDIEVTVRNGQVFLNGEAGSYYIKEQARSTAAAVPGVIAVDTKGLTVRDEKETEDDAVIAASIERELWWNPFVDSDRSDVVVEDGAATLRGVVADAHERNIAANEAYEGGADTVYNNITVRE